MSKPLIWDAAIEAATRAVLDIDISPHLGDELSTREVLNLAVQAIHSVRNRDPLRFRQEWSVHQPGWRRPEVYSNRLAARAAAVDVAMATVQTRLVSRWEDDDD